MLFSDLHSQRTLPVLAGELTAIWSKLAWLVLVLEHPRFLQSNMPGGDNKKSKLNIYEVLSFGIQQNQIKASKKQACISPLFCILFSLPRYPGQVSPASMPSIPAKVREYHTERQVHFVVRMDGNKLKEAEQKDGIEVAMKLKGSINETNMVLFNHEGKITKYKNAKEIMQEFAKVRLKM